MSTGTRYSAEYPLRLANMLRRRWGGQLKMTCFTDQHLPFDDDVEQVDVSGWGLKGTHSKIKLFDRTVIDEPYLLLDTTLVLRDDLEKIVLPCIESGKDMCVMKDWGYECMQGCIRYTIPTETTEEIWKQYVAGKKYPFMDTKEFIDYGEQNFVWAAMQDLGLDKDAFWFPVHWVESYRRLRKLAASDYDEAVRRAAAAVIIKFHGKPNPHVVVDRGGCIRSGIRRFPLKPKTWAYLQAEMEDCWR
jgi:hypothetical protein